MFAMHLHWLNEHAKSFINLLLIFLHGVMPIMLIHFQGDDGTALIYFFIIAMMVFVADIPKKYIISLFVCVIIVIPFAWNTLNTHQKARIFNMFNLELDISGIGYQQHNARIAIGSGKCFGKGLFYKFYQNIPEMKNDFIFSFIGESLGFLGCIFLILLLLLFCCEIVNISLKAKGISSKLACIGIFGLFFSQIILNIGMNVSLLPVVGITLPLLSSGGSSIISSYIGIGFVLNIAKKNDENLFR
jgi:rod shape determining protein RodA